MNGIWSRERKDLFYTVGERKGGFGFVVAIFYSFVFFFLRFANVSDCSVQDKSQT